MAVPAQNGKARASQNPCAKANDAREKDVDDKRFRRVRKQKRWRLCRCYAEGDFSQNGIPEAPMREFSICRKECKPEGSLAERNNARMGANGRVRKRSRARSPFRHCFSCDLGNIMVYGVGRCAGNASGGSAERVLHREPYAGYLFPYAFEILRDGRLRRTIRSSNPYALVGR